MKRVSFLLVLLVLAAAFIMVACEKKQETTGEATTEETTTEESAETTMESAVSDTGMATDPVCGMTMEKSKMVAYEEDGETIYFCSEECKDKYLAEKATEEEKEAPASEE